MTIPTPDSVYLPESANELRQQLQNLCGVVSSLEQFLEGACPNNDVAAQLADAKEEYLELYAQAKTYEVLAGADKWANIWEYSPYGPVVMPIIKRKNQ